MVKKMKSTTLKKSIKNAHAKARWVGFFYLLGSIILLALSVLPILSVTDGEGVWNPTILNFFEPLLNIVNGSQVLGLNPYITVVFASVIYTVIVLALVINVIVCFTKLGWLYKNTASAAFGFNRPEYAMEDMGRAYSSSFAAWVLGAAAICVVSGSLNAESMLFVYIGLGVAVLLHLWLGLVGGNVTLYNVTPTGIVEDKRKYGRFSVFVRNLFQIAAVAGIIYFVAESSVLKSTVASLANGSLALDALLADINLLIPVALEALTLLFWVILAKHATAITEFDRDGKKAPGMKNFAIFSLLVFICTAASLALAIVGGLAIDAVLTEKLSAVIVAGIGLVMFIFELILGKCPNIKKSILKEQAAAEAAAAAAALAAMPAPRPSVNFSFLNQPSIIKQGGHEYMIMPLEYDKEYIPEEDELYNYDFYFASEEE